MAEDDARRAAEERSSPPSSVVYDAIFEEGEHELRRSTTALAWSGLAAGLSMGFSFLTAALIHAHLPAGAKWAPLVTGFGYTIGFVIVILGRQQLFTENTLTVVLPLLRRRARVTNVLRLWGAVLAANLTGAFLFALVLAKTEAVSAETYESLVTIAKEAHMQTFAVTLLRAVFAGWLIALAVWLLPFAETSRVLVIILLTWIIGASHYPHIVAGSVDSLFLVFTGDQNWADFVVGFFTPALLGNIIGGVSLVAAISHAQVAAERGGNR